MSLNSKTFLKWKPLEGTWTTSFEGPNQETYRIVLSPFWEQKLHLYVKEFGPEQIEFLKQGTWLVEFFDSKGSKELTGKQGMKASIVFGIVGNAVYQRAMQYPNEFKNFVVVGESQRYNFYMKRYVPLWAEIANKDLFLGENKTTICAVDKEMPKIRKRNL